MTTQSRHLCAYMCLCAFVPRPPHDSPAFAHARMRHESEHTNALTTGAFWYVYNLVHALTARAHVRGARACAFVLSLPLAHFPCSGLFFLPKRNKSSKIRSMRERALNDAPWSMLFERTLILFFIFQQWVSKPVPWSILHDFMELISTSELLCFGGCATRSFFTIQ